jgi:hypothetical protein
MHKSQKTLFLKRRTLFSLSVYMYKVFSQVFSQSGRFVVFLDLESLAYGVLLTK